MEPEKAMQGHIALQSTSREMLESFLRQEQDLADYSPLLHGYGGHFSSKSESGGEGS